MCCGPHHRHHGRGCWDDAAEWEEHGAGREASFGAPHFARRWGAGHGPPPWAAQQWEQEAPPWASGGYGWGFHPRWWQPSQAEHKEWLETIKKHLEARLAEVNEELNKAT